MSKEKTKKVFVQGAISPEKIAKSVSKHQTKTGTGAHSIFLGQVRADEINGKKVTAIDYSAYEEMAEKEFHTIKEVALTKFDLTSVHIYHSLGVVKAGEICLIVFTSSAHRNAATDACRFIVEELKVKVPIFGKELFEDQTHQWKVNR